MSTYKRGGCTIKYDTTKKPGYTKLVATWDNPEKARKAQERTVAKAKREEAKKKNAEAKRVKKLKSKK